MNFHIGSARAAMEDIGNQASDIHVYGGDYGIITKRTAPAWQFLLMDSTFEGQRRRHPYPGSGMTLIRNRFAHMPVAIEIAQGEVEQLFGRDLQLEDIRDAAIAIGNPQSPKTEVTLENIACTNVPSFSRGHESVKSPAKHYVIDRFTHGLGIGSDGRERGIVTQHHKRALAKSLPAVPTDIPILPPMNTWINVHTLGVKGDGATDDTAALQAAVDKHDTLYFPTGVYRLTTSLKLHKNSILIGLNPITTQLVVLDNTETVQGKGDLIPLLIAPQDGTNIVTGIGVSTGVANPRAAGVLWMAGVTSMLEDMTFQPGLSAPIPALWPHRTPSTIDRAKMATYLGTQGPDLWIKDGGGGIFRDLWTHDSYSDVGLRIENTSTPGRIYQLSCEHHMTVEAQFHNVQNWNIYALQTEEENPAGANAIAAEISDSNHLLFANTFMYRVSRNVKPKTQAVIVRNSDDIHFDNAKVFSQTRLAFDNAVLDETSSIAVRSRFFTHFSVQKGMKAAAPLPMPSVFAKNAKLEKLATGFSNASGLTTDDDGNLFFTDAAMHKIYRWNATARSAVLMGEIPGQPMVLEFVPPSNLLAIAYEKAVYSLDTKKPAPPRQINETSTELADTKFILPVGFHNELKVYQDYLQHRGYVYRQGSNTAILSVVENEPRNFYYAPRTTTAITAGGTWRPLLQSSQLAVWAPGDKRLITSEDDERTYWATLDNNRHLTTTVFAERGGNAVVTDAVGNVYIAAGQVYIYDHSGKQVGVLEVPERPASLALGGPRRNTLFIGARSSLYAIEIAVNY